MAKRTNRKKKPIIERIKDLEDAIRKSNDYLESGKYADWRGFRPLFAHKIKDGQKLPPHRDWVKNVFLPGIEKALRRAEKLLERFS
jgi:hypothetical protein